MLGAAHLDLPVSIGEPWSAGGYEPLLIPLNSFKVLSLLTI